MDPRTEAVHYHIHWSRVAPLNWKCFNTRAEAAALAELFTVPGETYAIEEHGEVSTLHGCREREIEGPLPL